MGKFTTKYDKVCAQCGKHFVATTPRAMFCSKKCKTKSYTVPKRDPVTGTYSKVCSRCGISFSSKCGHTRMCPDCSKQSQRESVYRWRQTNPDWEVKWRKEHPESLAKAKKKWNQANPDKVAEHERRHAEKRRQQRLDGARERAITRAAEIQGIAVEYGPITDPKKRDMFLESLGIQRITVNKCRCVRCGMEFPVAVKESSALRNLRRRAETGTTPCPKCGTFPLRSHYSQNGSMYEYEIAGLYPNLSVTHYKPDFMKGKEIDLYDPVAKVGIEFHGLFSHSSRLNKSCTKHATKADLCEKAGIQLIQIFETEWVQRKDCVIDKLDAIFHRDMERVFARKLEVRELNDAAGRKLVSSFMDKNHIQGHAMSQWAVGLFRGDEPLAVCTFKYGTGYATGGHVAGTERYWELNRYATRLHCSVVGGISRCVKAFLRAHEGVDRIVSFADRRWTCPSRSAYSSSGFVETGRCPVNYIYTDLNPHHPVHSKQYMRKSQIMRRASADPSGKEATVYSPDLTENEMAIKLGFYRLYDAGKIRYEYAK